MRATIKITEIAKNLKSLKSALIFCHHRPDGDTLGSAIALKFALEGLGLKTQVVCESDVPEKFSFIKGIESIVKPELIQDSYDGYVAVDCSVPSMFLGSYHLFEKAVKTYNVDHHVSNGGYAKFNYVENLPSNCENIYALIKEMGCEITKEIANALLLGIVTDTGNFAHSNVTSKTLEIASELVFLGADLHLIIQKTFKSQSKQRAGLYAHVISKMRYFLEDTVAVITITKADLDKFDAKDNMTEGFIDFPLSVNGVEVAISLLEVGTCKYKVSFRSKGKVDVNEIACIYGGGGHVLASGAMLNGHIEDIIDKLVYNVKQRI